MNKALLKGKNYEGIVTFERNTSPDTLQINPKQEDNNPFYTSFYTQNFLKKTREYQASLLLKEIKPLLSASSSILEIGCGDGLFIDRLLKTHKGHVLGIDPFLKEEGNNKLKCGLYEFKGDKFDCIILLDVFEHFKDNRSALEKINSHLKEGGHLILKVPNKDALFYKIAKLFSVFNISFLSRLYQIDFPPQHFFYYNKDSLKNVCISAGFKYLKHFYMSEVPVRGLYNRLWGVSPLIKIIALPLTLLYNIISLGFLRDAVVVCFQKEGKC